MLYVVVCCIVELCLLCWLLMCISGCSCNVWCLVFGVWRVCLVVRGLLRVVCCLVFDVVLLVCLLLACRWFVDCSSLFGVYCFVFVVCCALCIVYFRCLLFVMCLFVHMCVVRCVLFVVRCLLFRV